MSSHPYQYTLTEFGAQRFWQTVNPTSCEITPEHSERGDTTAPSTSRTTIAPAVGGSASNVNESHEGVCEEPTSIPPLRDVDRRSIEALRQSPITGRPHVIHITVNVALPSPQDRSMVFEMVFNMVHWVPPNPNGPTIHGRLRAVRLDSYGCYRYMHVFVNQLRRHGMVYLVDEHENRRVDQNPDGPSLTAVRIRGDCERTDSAALSRYTDEPTTVSSLYILPDSVAASDDSADAVLTRRSFNTVQCHQPPGPRGRGAFCTMNIDLRPRRDFRFSSSRQPEHISNELAVLYHAQMKDTMNSIWIVPGFLEFEWC